MYISAASLIIHVVNIVYISAASLIIHVVNRVE